MGEYCFDKVLVMYFVHVSKRLNKIMHTYRHKPPLERLVLVAAVATPIMTLPQVYTIWVGHDKGASALTWASYVIIAFIWLAYGIQKREHPIIIMQSLCIVTYSAVVVGLLI
jgi:MtN3 and saliva related transmembrane protein